MFMKDALTVAKKELKAALKDKAILMQMLILPFVIVFGYSLLMSSMTQIGGGEVSETTEAQGYYVNAPDYMEEGLKALSLESKDASQTESVKKQVEDKECALLVVFPEDFAIAENGSSELSDIEVWYNSENTQSSAVVDGLYAYLDTYRPMVFTINADDENTHHDLGDEFMILRKLLGTLLPMMLLMAVFMVCMNLAANSIAGDKEHGFLCTMLITPVKRSSIAAGKSLCIFGCAVIGGLSAFVGMALGLPKIAEAMSPDTQVTFTISEYLILFAVTLTAVFALGGILLIVSAISKNVKQATTIAPIFLMVLMVAAMLSTVDAFSSVVENLGMVNNIIPAWNTIINMQKIISLDYSASAVIITCIANLIFSVLAIFVTGKLFENEKILETE